MQENWIGKSQGCASRFSSTRRRRNIPSFDVFTTRPDTMFGASFAAIAADHPLASALATMIRSEGLHRRVQGAPARQRPRSRPPRRRASTPALSVVHPLDPELEAAVWFVANFVLMDYGTGAIFGCPAHDQRDLDFARKYELPVHSRRRLRRRDRADFTGDEAYVGGGIAGQFGLPRRHVGRGGQGGGHRARRAEGWGKGTTVWRLRDWGVSRQRYWGTPIPIIHCERLRTGRRCPPSQLPVILPEDVSFDIPGNPLDRHPTWKHVDCPMLRQAGAARDRHARHVRRFLLVFHPLRQPAFRQAVRPRGGRELAARRAIYRRGRACDPAPALRPLLDPRARAYGQDLDITEPFAACSPRGW
jgi:leucyl-tRNA synthetase